MHRVETQLREVNYYYYYYNYYCYYYYNYYCYYYYSYYYYYYGLYAVTSHMVTIVLMLI